ncbi:MAG: M14 family zinc carboxypeptidase [Bdellovibrionota bacterium]
MKYFATALSSALLFTGSVSAHASIKAIGATDRQYTDVQAFVQQLAHDYPKTVSLFTLGTGDTGQPIVGLKIGNGLIHNLLVSTHHGNEYGSTEVALAFAESVAKSPIQNQTLYVIPVLNIGGYNARNREETDSRGVSDDPNRNYPGPCGTEGPFTLKSTKALADFIDHESIVVSATMHTFFPAVVYPWGISTHDLNTPYMTEFTKLVNDATQESHYQIGNSTEVIYPADGAYEDWAFWKHGIWSILFEVGETHTPDSSQIKDMVATNVPGLRRMFENGPTQVATQHEFSGRCDNMLARLRDRHDE